MNAIVNFLTGRLVALLVPWIVSGIQFISHYGVDTKSWDAPTISTFIVTTICSLLMFWIAQRKKTTADGVKQIQEATNGSVAPGTVAVDGVAKTNGETVASVKALVAIASNPNRKG